MLTIGISGGSGSGKSTVVSELIRRLPDNTVAVIQQDSYYWDNGDKSQEEKQRINFDHPEAIEWELLITQLKALKQGEAVELPHYSYVSCARSPETTRVQPEKIIIVEGILILTEPALLDLLDIKVFVETDEDERMKRIISRDMKERGRSVDEGVRHYETFVKPMHLQFIEPSKKFADIIVHQGGKNQQAMDILASNLYSASHLPDQDETPETLE